MPLLDLAQLYRTVTTAHRPADVFGPLDGPLSSQLTALARVFRTLVRVAHPDHCPDDQRRAEQTFHHLEVWRQRAEEELRTGAYGSTATPVTLRTGTYEIHEPLKAGDYYTLYRCTTSPMKPGEELQLKVVHDERDNELLRHEAQVLRRLARAPAPARRYFPRLVESFVWKDSAASRQALLMAGPANLYSLADIRAAFPAGLDPRDAAWMFNRTLEALWFAHQQNLVHGAVLPPSLHVSLEDHGLVLDDWALAVESGEPLTALSVSYAAWYPGEARLKAPATPATDLFLATRCLVYLLGGDPVTGQLPLAVPAPFHRFVKGCLLPSPVHRPQDVGALREEFDDLLENLYGPRAFRPLAMPA
jgi:hypothetical protein